MLCTRVMTTEAVNTYKTARYSEQYNLLARQHLRMLPISLFYSVASLRSEDSYNYY